MEAKLFYGKALGVPVGGTVVDIDAADASAVINSTSGLVKELFKVGTTVALGASLGLGLLSVLSVISELLRENVEEPSLPIASMARIRMRGGPGGWYNRDFNGILMDDTIDIITDDNKLKISGEYITRIESPNPGYFYSNYFMHLVDGSMYSNFKFEKKKYNFASISGLQTVNMRDIVFIKGYTSINLNQLKSSLTFALDHSLDDIINTIGKPTFDKFFVLK